MLQRILLYVGLVAVYIPFLIVDIKLEASSPVFDAASSLLGFVNPALTAFAFIDYTYLSAFSSFLDIPIHAMNLATDPIQVGYLIYAIYSLICEIISIFNVTQLYKSQKTANK